MNKEIISANRINAFLTENIEKFSGFVGQVIHDKEFLECVEKLLPFDGVACASMNVVPEKQGVKKLGAIVMRMDLNPPLFSLAVTMTLDGSYKDLHDISVFMTACKTIKELQEYVNDKKFREEVMEQCRNRIFRNGGQLQKIASPVKR